MPKRIALIPDKHALSLAPLTDSRIKVGDNRSEYDGGQLDGLAPFGPLKGIRSTSRDLRLDGRFADLLGHRLAAARAQSSHRVRVSSAMRQYRQTRRKLPCCMEMISKNKK